MKIRAFASLAALAALALLPSAQAQQPKTSGGTMLHLNTVSVEKSLAFYRDVLGMEVFNDGQFRDGANLGGAPGAKLRTVQLKVPQGDFQLELIEWQGATLNPQHLRIQDPGQVMLAFGLRDMQKKLDGAKKLGLKVLSKNGAIETSGNMPAIMVADPSGFVVELNDFDHAKKAPENAWPGQITNVGIFISVDNLDKTVAYYNKIFGFEMKAGPANPATDRIKTLFNEPKFTTFRTARGSFSGMKFPPVTFQEFGGVDKKAVHHGVMDPGGPILPITMTDFKSAVADVVALGGTIGQGDKSETLAPDARATWTRDPNGWLQRLAMPAPPRPAAN